ncbi:MAG TPA: methyltransferase domain-containing protein [Burkholderiaceae bacterium]
MFTAPKTFMSVSASTRAVPDLAAIKQRQQASWASGDFAVIGTTFQIVGENLVEAADVRAGEKVLDVAAGSGNATLAAARRFAHVTSTDHVPSLLDKGRERAHAEGLPAVFRVADAEALPFADASFDVVLSTFGVMYALDQAQAARELKRVLKPGGRIGLANWTPRGFVGRLFKVIGAHVPPTHGLASPALWGTAARLAAIFGVTAAQIRSRRRPFNFRYRSAAHWVQVFRDFHGPTHTAFAALDANGQLALERDLTALLENANTAGARSLVVPGAYLEAVITTCNPPQRK